MKIDVLQVPYDSGRRDFRMGGGPMRLVEGGLLSHLSGHAPEVIPVQLDPGFKAEISSAFDLAKAIRFRVSESLQRCHFPLILSGNCIAALGTVAALVNPDVYWFDAHGDLNTPESTKSGYLDGMALAILLGRCWRSLSTDLGLQPVPEQKVWLLGARDLDPAEKDFLLTSRLRWIRSDQEMGSLPMKNRPDGAYLHIDLDVLDPSVGTANSYASAGGFSLEGLKSAIERIGENTVIRAAALTAYDPAADPSGLVVEAAIEIAEYIASVVSR